MPRGMKRSITSIARDLANTVTRGGRKVIPTRRPGEDGGPSRGGRGRGRGRPSRVEQAPPSSSTIPSATGTEDEVEESERGEEEEEEEEGAREERAREEAEETAREEEEETELAQVTRKPWVRGPTRTGDRPREEERICIKPDGDR